MILGKASKIVLSQRIAIAKVQNPLREIGIQWARLKMDNGIVDDPTISVA